MPEDESVVPDDLKRMFGAKRDWHLKQAQLPLREKVRILLQLQKEE